MKNTINVLFVCSANKQRSKTADDYFSEKYVSSLFRFDSAGTNLKICMKEGSNPLSEDLLEWADVAFVMETKHKKLINANTGSAFQSKIKVLNIPDRFKYFQKELLDILDEKVLPHLESYQVDQ